MVILALDIFDIDVLEPFIRFLSDNIWNVVISFLIVTGGSLFPDLDSNRSTAEFRLGTTGKLISLFMTSTGRIIYTLYHFSYDKKPSFMHRALYHTPLFLGVLWYLFYAGIPTEGEAKFVYLFLDSKVYELPKFLTENAAIILVLIMSFLFIRLSLATITYRAFRKVFKKQIISDILIIIMTIPLVIKIASMPYENIKMFSYIIVFGYGTHLLGDLFTRGSIPLFYPIPIKGEAYFRPNFPLQISTNEGPAQITNKILIISISFLFLYNLYYQLVIM